MRRRCQNWSHQTSVSISTDRYRYPILRFRERVREAVLVPTGSACSVLTPGRVIAERVRRPLVNSTKYQALT